MADPKAPEESKSSVGKTVAAVGKWGVGIALGVVTVGIGVGHAGVLGWEMTALGLSVSLWSAYQAREDYRAIKKVEHIGNTSTSKMLGQASPLNIQRDESGGGRGLRSAMPAAVKQEIAKQKNYSTTATMNMMFQRQTTSSKQAAQVQTTQQKTSGMGRSKK